MYGTINNFTKNEKIQHFSKSLSTRDRSSCSEQVHRENSCQKNNLHSSNYRGEFLSKIEKLNLSFCGLLKIPIQIFQIKFLKVLNLSNNRITILPNEIQNLKNLIYLDLSGNKLSYLPKYLNIDQLFYLNLSQNEFSKVPDVFFLGLKNIKILDLSFNKISEFQECPFCFSNLIQLNLSNNLLKILPQWIFDGNCQIQILDLGENAINLNWPSTLVCFNSGIFKNLKILNLSSCKIDCEKIKFFSYFKKLEVLHLGTKNNLLKFKNFIGDLNIDAFRGCCNLKYLFIDNAQISFLPGSFDQIPHIEILSLSGNMLSWLPQAFCNFSHLVILDLSSNQLLFLPNNIGNLINLKYFNLANNFLYQLPESFCKLNSLEFVDLYNNNIDVVNSNIFTMKSLIGIDLGMNCLDFNKFDCDSENNQLKRKYNLLKEKFREKFSYSNNRSDKQILNTEENYHGEQFSYSSSNSLSFEEKSLSDTDFNYENNQENFLNIEENWEEEYYNKPDEDEAFDPESLERKENKNNLRLSQILEAKFQDYYFPSSTHVLSIVETYSENIQSALVYKSVEGQFDSDLNE